MYFCQVMKKLTAVLAAAVALGAAGAQTGTVMADLKPLVGNWKGTMAQANIAQSYPIKLTIYPAARAGNQVVAKVDYPSLQCGGEWRLKNASGSTMVVDEVITYGRCIDGQMQVSTYVDPKSKKTLLSVSSYVTGTGEYAQEINIKASLFRVP